MDEQEAAVRVREGVSAWGSGGPGAEVSWLDADCDSLGLACGKVADSGVLLMLSRSQDGQALMVAFMDNGETERRWFHEPNDAVAAIDGIVDYIAERPPSSPSRGGQGRNRQRSRKPR